VYPSRLQIDFDADLSSNLFCVRGNLMVPGNCTIPYLLLNATLWQGSIIIKNTKYLLLQVESGTDHSFEICKNMMVLPGSYNCTLEVKGPKGTLNIESRKCTLEKPLAESLSLEKSISSRDLSSSRVAPIEADQELSQDENIQETDERDETELKAQRVASKKKNPPDKSLQGKETLGLHVNAPQKDGAVETRTASNTSSTQSIEAKTEFVGSSTSKKYHLLTCRYASKIKPENKIHFENAEDALKQGYLPCKVCNP
jgi:hypothetical protein